MKNLGLKLFSLIIALGLFHFVNSEGNSSVVGFVAPVEVRNLSASKIIVWPETLEARVTVKGPAYLVSRIATSKQTFKLTLPEQVPDRYVGQLLKADLALPAPVDVLTIDPPEIELLLENVSEKTVPVVLPRIGSLPSELQLEEIRIAPASVTLRGPESGVNAINALETDPVDLREVDHSVSFESRIRSPGKHIRLMPETVQVDVTVSSVQSERTFADLEVEIRSRGELKFGIKPRRVSVTVRGAMEAIDALDPELMIPFVRLTPDDVAGTSIEVNVDLPEGVQLGVVEPKTVGVIVVSGRKP